MALHTGVRSVRFGDGQLQFHTDEDAVGDDHQGKCQIKGRTGHQPFPQSRTHRTIHRHVAEMFSYLTIRRPSQNKINKLETWNWNWGIFITDKPDVFHGVSIFLGFVVPPFGENPSYSHQSSDITTCHDQIHPNTYVDGGLQLGKSSNFMFFVPAAMFD